MSSAIVLSLIDRLIKPKEWYEVSNLSIEGFQFIGTKDDQKNAGLIEKPIIKEKRFGLNPFKPYRDYYGKLILKTRLVPEELEVKYAIGYTINQKVTTVDDYSNFAWLRLATGIEKYIYPNLSHQKQLLEFLLANSRQPKFVITRVYHYLQFELYQQLTTEILKRENA